MSIRAILNDSIAAIRTIFDLEDTVVLAADLLRATLLSGHKVLVCGNGGSATDAMDLVADLSRPLPSAVTRTSLSSRVDTLIGVAPL